MQHLTGTGVVCMLVRAASLIVPFLSWSFTKMKKMLSVAAVSGLVVAGVVFAAGFAQPATGQPGSSGQPPARGTGAGGGGGQPGGPGGQGGGQQGRGGRQGQGAPGLDASMKGMGRALEALEASIGDASKKDENLRLLGDAQRFCASAKNARPTEAINEAKDDAAKAKIANDYRKHLIDVLKALIDAEVATMDGKTAEAKAALGKVVALRDSGHKDFGVKDKGNGGSTNGVPPMLPPGGAR